MTTPTKPRRRFTAQQKAEAVELCLQEDLSCNAVAHRLGLPSSSLARWVRQGRIDRGQAGPKDQGMHSTEERAELNRLRKVEKGACSSRAMCLRCSRWWRRSMACCSCCGSSVRRWLRPTLRRSASEAGPPAR